MGVSGNEGAWQIAGSHLPRTPESLLLARFTHQTGPNRVATYTVKFRVVDIKSNGLRSRHQRRRPGRRIDRRLHPTAPRGRTRAGHGLLCRLRLRLHAPARLGRRATELVRHAATRPSSTAAKLCSPPPSEHMDLADPHRSDALFSAVTGPRPLPMHLAPGLAWPRAADGCCAARPPGQRPRADRLRQLGRSG